MVSSGTAGHGLAYPGYRIPSLIHRLVPPPFFFAHGNRGPTSNGFGACHDQKQQYLAYSTRQLCVRQFGDQASYRQASFLTCLHAIAFAAFPMFITFFEVYTSVKPCQARSCSAFVHICACLNFYEVYSSVMLVPYKRGATRNSCCS